MRTSLRAASPRKHLRKSFSFVAALSVLGVGLLAPISSPALANTDGTGLVITEAYTRGGSADSTYLNKFVEIYNPTDSDVSVEGLSVQYLSSTATTASSVCKLSGTVAAGETYVIVGGTNGSTGEEVTGDLVCSGINPSATNGSLVLVDGTEKYNFAEPSADMSVIDLLGYGSAVNFETAAAASEKNGALSIQRDDAATDTDDNSADFSLSAPTPGVVGDSEPGDEPTTDPTEEPTTEPTSEPTVEPTTEPTVEPTEDPTEEPTEPTVVAIAEIQGTGDTSPLSGQEITTEGIVTGVYADGGLKGYFIQTPGTGTEKTVDDASDGVFVYDSTNAATLAEGQCIQLTATVTEYKELTELKSVSDVTELSDCEPVTAVEISEANWPATDEEKESYEGMLIAPTGDWTVTNNYSTNQYGSVGLAVGDEPLYQATDVVAPGEEAIAYEAENQLKEITLDDGSTWNYGRMTNEYATSSPLPYLSLENSLRAGDAVDFTQNVIMDYRFGWAFQPTAQVVGTDNLPITWENSREAAPEVGGNFSVASFNVLNYFTDLGEDEDGCSAYEDREGNGNTGNYCTVRGAYTAEAFERQQTKIVAAINELDASVVGLEEIENSAAFGHDRDESLSLLVDALNEAAGETRWAYAPSPEVLPEEEDVIRTAFIYQVDEVELVGESTILISDDFAGTAREPLAQAFKVKGASDDDAVMVITNHFKSKGSLLDGDDNADSGDGQGNNNGQRVLQAQALVEFASQWEDMPVILMGDFNAYSQEDPVTTMEAGGYTLIDDVVDNVGLSYQYSGRLGSLDHVLLNDAALELVAGAQVWDINADEAIAYEYSRNNYNVTNLYAPDAYRASDHDPVKVGLNMVTAEEPVDPVDPVDPTEPTDPTDPVDPGHGGHGHGGFIGFIIHIGHYFCGGFGGFFHFMIGFFGCFGF